MEISILQWNVWYRQDIRNIANFLIQQKPDIVCLQELTKDYPDQFVSDTSKYIAEQLGLNYFNKELPIEDTNGTKRTLANGVFSRFPIVQSRAEWTNESKRGGGADDEYRAYVEATLDVEGKRLTVGTTHMSYTHRFEITPHKRAETDKLIKLIGEKSDCFVFTGDLNAIPGSYTIDKISQELKSAGPDYDQKTWATKPFSYNGFEESELNWRLDYVFVSSDVKVLSSEILPTEYSDHLPILTKIKLP